MSCNETLLQTILTVNMLNETSLPFSIFHRSYQIFLALSIRQIHEIQQQRRDQYYIDFIQIFKHKLLCYILTSMTILSRRLQSSVNTDVFG